MPHPIVKAFVDKGCQSFLIGCPETRKAVVIDPKVGRRATIAKALTDFGLDPVAVVDTHTHADHLSDSHAFLRDGLPVYMSRLTRCRRRITRVGDDDEIEIGALRFRVLEIPGHTDDSIGLFGHGLVVAGDTLLVGSLARADFRGSDPAKLFDSVARKLLTLPDDTVLLPGHSYNDVLFSTIGVEKRKNPALRHENGAAYAAAAGGVEGAGNTPDVDRMLALNQEANPDLPEDPATVAACCAAGGAGAAAREREMTPDELRQRREEFAARGAWIDVRDAWEFGRERIPGTRNVPLGELGFHLDELRGRDPVVLSCLGGVRSMTAARTLRYLDVLEQPISMSGGFREWKERGLEVESAAVR